MISWRQAGKCFKQVRQIETRSRVTYGSPIWANSANVLASTVLYQWCGNPESAECPDDINTHKLATLDMQGKANARIYRCVYAYMHMHTCVCICICKKTCTYGSCYYRKIYGSICVCVCLYVITYTSPYSNTQTHADPCEQISNGNYSQSHPDATCSTYMHAWRML